MTRSRAAAAAKAFEETLEELDLPDHAPDLIDPAAFGRRAALLAASETIWGKYLGPLLETEAVQTLLRVNSRQAVSDLAKRRKLLTLDASGGRKLYPAFQFNPSGRPYPEIAQIIEIFTGAVESPYTIASWFVSPQDLLDGETPMAWLKSHKDSSRLLEAARRSAGELDLF